MNWPVVKFLTEHARKFNTLGKNLNIVLVTNLLLMDDEKMRFLADHNVDVCTSLDGPADIHDKNKMDAARARDPRPSGGEDYAFFKRIRAEGPFVTDYYQAFVGTSREDH